MRCLLPLLLLICFAMPARADDLAEIKAMLVPLRMPSADEARGAKPVFVEIKHRLRAWVEGKLEGLPADGDVKAYAQSLNEDLAKAGLMCDEPDLANSPACPSSDNGISYDRLGFIRRIGLRRVEADQPYVLVTIPLGLTNCRFDQSAYLYRNDNEHWRRVWTREQLRVGKNEPTLGDVDYVKISAPRPEDGRRLLLAYGVTFGCASMWTEADYGLWLVGERQDQQSSLENWHQYIYAGVDDPILGQVTPFEALVQFHVGSMDVDVHNRYALRRIAVEGSRVKTVRKETIGPRDFLEDYIQERWPHVKYLSYGYPLQRCGDDAALWQIPMYRSTVGYEHGPLFFGWVRWRQPDLFEVLGFGYVPRNDCRDVADEEAISLPPPLQATESYWGPPVTYHENSAPQAPATTQ